MLLRLRAVPLPLLQALPLPPSHTLSLSHLSLTPVPSAPRDPLPRYATC